MPGFHRPLPAHSCCPAPCAGWAGCAEAAVRLGEDARPLPLPLPRLLRLQPHPAHQTERPGAGSPANTGRAPTLFPGARPQILSGSPAFVQPLALGFQVWLRSAAFSQTRSEHQSWARRARPDRTKGKGLPGICWGWGATQPSYPPPPRRVCWASPQALACAPAMHGFSPGSVTCSPAVHAQVLGARAGGRQTRIDVRTEHRGRKGRTQSSSWERSF